MRKIKKIIRIIQYKVIDVIYSDRKYVKAFWWNTKINFGDLINENIIKILSKKSVIWVNPIYYKKTNYLCIGSILHKANKHSIIWGSGFIDEKFSLNEKPKKIYAVRGPKTRDKLIHDKIDCPKVYGDPALLLPLLYSPTIDKKYKYGIIPHLSNKNNPWIENINNKDILIIDIQEKNPYKFVDYILSCENIISTSLHGLIISDAYKIPSLWIEFENESIGDSWFKFLDYYQSINNNTKSPIIINKLTKFEDIKNNTSIKKIELDINLLINSCPFINSSVKETLIKDNK